MDFLLARARRFLIRGRHAFLLCSLTACLPAQTQSLQPGIAAPAPYRKDRIIIRPRNDVTPEALQQFHRRMGTATKALGHRHRLERTSLPRGQSVAAALAAYRKSGLVEYAEPDYLLQPLLVPNDFNYQNQDQWNLHNTGIYGGVAGADIMAEAGWDLQPDAPDIIVAVVDSGIRYTHEDLAPNMWVNPGESGLDSQGRDRRTNGVDDDANGYVDDVHGINVLNGSGDPQDDWGHGTHVAGIVGARGNNATGVAGVAWRVRLMACKFIDANAAYSVSDAVRALDYARVHGARIVTASWGGYAFDSQALRDAFAALREAGILVAAAAGNDNSDNDRMPLYPASYDFDNIITVAATNRTDDRAGYSNYGAQSVDLGAPGSPVFSTWADTDRGYRYHEGTSMAAPHAAGAAALLWTRFPGDTPRQIIQRLLGSVDPLPALGGRTVSGGRLNLAAALASGTPPPPPVAPAAPSGLQATAVSSSTVSLSWFDNSDNETGFELQRSTDNATFTTVLNLGAHVTSASVSGLAASTTHYFRLRATQGGTVSEFSPVASATTTAAEAPPPSGSWLSADVGAVSAAGASSGSGDGAVVSGSGADIWDGADEFHYRYQLWTGDGSITARVTSLANTHGWAKAGVMFRETLGAGSAHAFMCVSAGNGTAFQRRTAAGASSSSTSGGTGSSLPKWVRLVREGAAFTAYESTDGSAWIQVGTETIAMPPTIYVGLAVTSHADGVVCTANFDAIATAGDGSPPPPPPATVDAPSALVAAAVSSSQIDLNWTDNAANETGYQIERSLDQIDFVPVILAGPDVTSYSDVDRASGTTYYYRVRAIADGATSEFSNVASATTATSGDSGAWSESDIGAVGVAGSNEAGGNTLTVRGSGSDIWEGADVFRFVYQQLAGDCVVEAQVSSLSNTHAWAKAGVMIRESLAANARNAFAFLTPANGMSTQARTATGGATVAQPGNWWVTAPHWVRLVRTGSQIIAFESADGSAWTQVAIFDIAMESTVYVGFAVTSHDNGQLAEAVFTDPFLN